MPWIKAVHVMAVISWLAGLFYLPRLFVYHADAKAGSTTSETFKVMEERLLRIIMRPAMIVTWLTGLSLAFWFGYFTEAWFLVKFALVIAMSAYHGRCVGWHRAFVAESNPHPSRYFRMVNEIPTVLMMLIVILVIVKPF